MPEPDHGGDAWPMMVSDPSGPSSVLLMYSMGMLAVMILVVYVSSEEWEDCMRPAMVEWLRRGQIWVLLFRHSEECLHNADDDAADECVLCLERLAIRGNRVTALPACRHQFHTACIERWLLHTAYKQRTCPICKRDPLVWCEPSKAKQAPLGCCLCPAPGMDMV